MPGKRRTQGRYRFTDQQIRAIRASREIQHVLALRYGVSMPTISHIRSRKTYRWVE